MSRALLTVAAVVLAFAVARLTVATEPVQVSATPRAPVHAPRIAYAPATQPSIGHAEAPAAEATQPDQKSAPAIAKQAVGLVDGALARGRWSDADRMQMRSMLGQMSESEANSVLGKLFTSINAGQLAVESTPL